MKKSKIQICQFTALFLWTLMLSCDSPVGFTKAQPAGGIDLLTFPEVYQGAFICEEDSVLIKVEDKIIYSEFTEIALMPMKYVQHREDCQIINDSIHMTGKDVCIEVEYMKGGMLSSVRITRDTIFEITPFQKARMHKGNLILSQPTESNLWTVGLLELDRDKGVTYRAIIDDSDLDRIQEITPMEQIASTSDHWPQYKISPKEVELEALFEDPTVFVDCNYYARVHLIQ